MAVDDHRSAREQYETEGYAIVRDAIDESLVEEAREHVRWLNERHPDTRPENLGHEYVTEDSFWVRLVSDDRLLDVVEAFFGPDIALFASHYIAKPPEDGQPVLWHQDGAYWPLDPPGDVLTVWLALDESTPANGCMRVIPGTQTMEFRDLEERTDVDNVLSSEMDTRGVDTDDAVDLELDPGDVSIHHPNIVHGSEPNTSDSWRRGLTIRYIPASTSIEEDPFPSAFLLRGEPEPGVNTYQRWPRYDPDEDLSFDGCEAWNDRAAAMNERVADAGCLVEE